MAETFENPYIRPPLVDRECSPPESLRLDHEFYIASFSKEIDGIARDFDVYHFPAGGELPLDLASNMVHDAHRDR